MKFLDTIMIGPLNSTESRRALRLEWKKIYREMEQKGN